MTTKPKTRRQVNERANKLLRKKAALAKGKQPERDAKYLAWIRTIWCVACYSQAWGSIIAGRLDPELAHHLSVRGQACHMGPHGLSQKASDYTAIPMCASCHNEIGSVIAKLEAKGIDYKALVAKLRESYEASK